MLSTKMKGPQVMFVCPQIAYSYCVTVRYSPLLRRHQCRSILVTDGDHSFQVVHVADLCEVAIPIPSCP